MVVDVAEEIKLVSMLPLTLPVRSPKNRPLVASTNIVESSANTEPLTSPV